MIGIAWFGNRDTLRFVQDAGINAPSGQQLCLMAKTTLSCFILPLALSKEYVWGFITARDQAKQLIHYRTDRYLPIANGEIVALQESGHLPSPLPPIKYRMRDVIAVWTGWLLVLMAIVGSLANHSGH